VGLQSLTIEWLYIGETTSPSYERFEDFAEIRDKERVLCLCLLHFCIKHRLEYARAHKIVRMAKRKMRQSGDGDEWKRRGKFAKFEILRRWGREARPSGRVFLKKRVQIVF
jgi:hypothetical protein